MIVTAIIAASVLLAMPYITNRNSQMRSFLRKFTVLSRELHTRAKLNGAVYRLVIEMPPVTNTSEQPVQRVWVERSNSKVVLSEKEEEMERERSEETDEKKKVDPKGFEPDATVLKSPLELPSGLRFEKVELTRLKNPVTEGKAFIHYLPAGLVDEAALHVKGQGTQAWTISIHPLTGRAEVIARTLSLKELRSQ